MLPLNDIYQWPNPQTLNYANPLSLSECVHALQQSPAPIDWPDITHWQEILRDIQASPGFILQLGDCCQSLPHDPIAQQGHMALLQQASHIIPTKPLALVGRFGQYSKPRSKPHLSNGQPAYRGPLLHEHAGEPFCPQRLLLAKDALEALHQQRTSPIFSSHELLHLPFSIGMQRTYRGQSWLSSTHWPWLGVRTASPHTPQGQLASQLNQPIAMKIGVHSPLELLAPWISSLSQQHPPVTLITRFGVAHIEEQLPRWLNALSHLPLLWILDPMHGNTQLAPDGHKVRYMEDMNAEIHRALEIHQKMNIPLHGLHLEATHEPVQECLDTPNFNQRTYKSLLDPRLNGAQCLALVRSFFATRVTPAKAGVLPGQRRFPPSRE